MSASLASEVWTELKRFINVVDREESADILVNLLIDNDIDIEEIKSNFKGDPDIRRAITQFTEDCDEEAEEDYDDEHDD